jgi:hypothetical protein
MLMPKFANLLDGLLADAVLTSGVDRQMKLDAVRAYIKVIPVERLNIEIAALTSKPELNMLQAVGVPLGAQPAFFYQYSKVAGV